MKVKTCRHAYVLKGCMSQYTRLLYWRDASHNTLHVCIYKANVILFSHSVIRPQCVSQHCPSSVLILTVVSTTGWTTVYTIRSITRIISNAFREDPVAGLLYRLLRC